MSGTKILWGQIIVVLAIILLTMWAATEWIAWKLAFQAELGRPWFIILRFPFYLPPAFFWWWYAYDAYAPEVFARGAYIAASGGILAALTAIGLSVWRAREAKRIETYGSARWADAKEIAQAGLLDPDGVVLGRYRREYLRHDGPEHVLTFAPTRSGKGVGMVIPTLLTWPGSAIVHDIKGENWELTAGFRARFGHVVLFDPTNAASAAYNPLLEIRRGEWEVRDAQNVADILVDPEGSLEKRNHWEKTSHSLLVGAILHVLYAEPDKTLAGVANFLSDPKRPIATTLSAMMRTKHLGDAGPHPVVASAARELLNKSPNERSGVLSTAMSFLGLYRDPVVAEVTRRCEWRIADIVGADRPVTLYLTVPPSDISRTKPLIRLVLNQIGRRLTEDLDAAARRRRVLLMLDEFPALGRLDFFESALAFMAGYRIKSFLIAQSLNQIERAYGPNNSILDNCHVRVSFATNDERTAKRVSDALGTATEMKAMKNYAGHRLSPWLGHLMVSRSETARPLLTAGEVMQLPPADEIVMTSGLYPIRAKKARYFEDARFQERILPPPKPTPPKDGCPDDWSSRPLPPRPPAPDAAAETRTGDDEEEDPKQSARRHQPELDEGTVEKKEPLENEFTPDPVDEFDDIAPRNNRMNDLIVQRLVKKTLYIGFFAFIIDHFSGLSGIVFNSFAALGLKAGGGTLAIADFMHPGRLAATGLDAAQPLLDAASKLAFSFGALASIVQILVLVLCWFIVLAAFFILAVQLFVAIVEFKLTSLAGFVLIPFALFNRTAFLAEKALGNVVSSGVKIMVLAVISAIASVLFRQFTTSYGDSAPTIGQALSVVLASLCIVGLAIFGGSLANGLISGAPQLGAGAAAGTAMAVGAMGAAAVAAPAALASGGAAALGATAAAARGGAAVAGAATTAYSMGAAGQTGAAGMASAAGNVGRAAGGAAMNAVKNKVGAATSSLKESYSAGGRWAAGAMGAGGEGDRPSGDGGSSGPSGGGGDPGTGPAGSGNPGGGPDGGDGSDGKPPRWARKMKRRNAATHAAEAAHIIRSADGGGGSTSIDLSEKE